jgi:hypothetical protein
MNNGITHSGSFGPAAEMAARAKYAQENDGFIPLEERLDRALAARGTPDSAPSVPVTVDLTGVRKTILPQGDAERKAAPMCRGLLDYFPAALFAVAAHSARSNEKHNPGEPIHWARGKSMDHADCIMRHLAERDLTALAWRALALLQEQCEAEGAAPGLASRFAAGSK